MGSYSSDVEFRAFLVELLIWSFNADGLDGGKRMGPALFGEPSTFLTGSGCFKVRSVRLCF